MEYNANGPVDEGNELQQEQPYTNGPSNYGGEKKKSKVWLWIVIAAVILCASAVVVMDVLGVFEPKELRPGNKGVWAVVDFFDQLTEMEEDMKGPAQKEMGDRFMKEPFEIDSRLSFSSDAFKQAGVPFDKISFDAKAKYDLKDLGVKLTLLGMVDIGAYLIEDDLVLDVMGEAASMPIELPIEEDLGANMSLEDRIKAFLPFLPEDDKLFKDVLTQFALSVSDEYTEEETVDVYSPLEDEKVEVKAITTTLDKDELREVLDTFAKGLDENEELKNDLQDIIDEITRFFDLEDVNIDDGLEEWDTQGFDDMDNFEFSWSVYRLNGQNVGFGMKIEIEDTINEMFFMVERDDNDIYTSTEITGEDFGNQEIQQKITYNGDKMLFESKQKVTSTDFNGEEQTVKVEISGTMEIEKDSDDEYHMEMDFEFVGDMDQTAQMQSDMPESISISYYIDADCLFGDDLGTLEESKEWKDIYDKDWGDIDDLFQGFGALPGLGTMM